MGARRAPDDDDQAEKYEVADDALSTSGRGWYEISNWSKPGHECRHNLVYWRQQDYVAIGAAAHGHAAGRRHWNLRTPERYVDAVRSGATVEAGTEVLDQAARDEEALFLAVRTREGIAVDPSIAAAVDELAGAGLLEIAGDRAVLTRRGRLLASDVTARLLIARTGPLARDCGARDVIRSAPPG